MKIIGLCGGSGSGKGRVCEILNMHNIVTIDTDLVYHKLTSTNSPCLDALVAEFGDDIVLPSGELDRKILSQKVFCGVGSDERRKKLNSIAHKFVLDEVRRILKELSGKNKFVFVDAPLLFESGFDKECDAVVCVIANRDIRIKRICERDALTVDKAEARINSQISDEELMRRSQFVVFNNESREELEKEVEELICNLERNFRDE